MLVLFSVLILLSCVSDATAFVPFCSLCSVTHNDVPVPTTTFLTRSTIRLKESTASSIYPWEGPLRSPEMQQYEQEETLLKIRCRVLLSNEKEQVLSVLQNYVQSFAFSSVLPVQPLTYMPTDDGGVQVQFLRKKTKEKGSVDGGLRFWILPVSSSSSSSFAVDSDKEEEVEEETVSTMITEQPTTTPTPAPKGEDDNDVIEIVVKRNSQGQTITKIFAEKQVITQFVECFTGKDRDASERFTNQNPPTDSVVKIESVFHKWM